MQLLHNDSEVDTIENDSPRCLDSGSESSSSCLSLEMESEFETEQDADHDKVFSDSVYDGCLLPCQISTILVMSLINRHKLTQRAAQDVIKVLIAHFPDGHRSFTSLYTLKTRFAALVGRQPEGEQIKFCTNCNTVLQSSNSCDCYQNGDKPQVGQFIQLGIEKQIQQLFKGDIT